MGPSLKLRRPFIWQDEMVEVRELFRRVDRVRKSGFTGFSTWGRPPPSADVLSRNRLRRRRALCSVELSHLNYKEAPYESLNHLQNIRGMCTRIQRQDYLVERKKKDVDLESCPPLLRRPVTSTTTNVERRGRKRPPFEVGRPYSAPVSSMQLSSTSTTTTLHDHLGSVPLQYAAPKLTSLYNITCKPTSSLRSSTRKSFNVVLPSSFDESPSTTSSKRYLATNKPLQRCAQGPLEQSLSQEFKLDESRNEQMEVMIDSSCEILNVSKDHQPSIRNTKQQQPLQNYHSVSNIATKEPLDIASSKYDNMNCCLPKNRTSNVDVQGKLDPFAYCGWSTSDEVTTSSDIDVSISTHNSKSHANDGTSSNFQDSCHDFMLDDFKASHDCEKPSFIRPISDYNQALSGTTTTKTRTRSRSKHEKHLSPSKRTRTPLFSKLVSSKSKFANVWDVSSCKRLATPPQDDDNSIDEDKQSPLVIRGGYNFVTNDTNFHNGNELMMSPLESKDDSLVNQYHHILCDLENKATFLTKTTNDYEKNALGFLNSNPPRSVLCENVKLTSETNSTNSTVESRWLTPNTCKAQLTHTNALNKLNEEDEMNNDADFRKYSSEGDELLSIQDGQLNANQMAISVDDPNVLIKHSSDPYSDFRSSMVTMIEEEGLQNQNAEVEELFQYYLDLNPKVHHQVLNKVIHDIRFEYKFLQNSFI